MKYFRLWIRGHRGQESRDFEFVLPAKSEEHAYEIIDQLLAHGHSIAGLDNGIATDNCEDIEGNDGIADRTVMFLTSEEAREYCDQFDDDLELVPGSIKETTKDFYLSCDPRYGTS